MWLKCWLCSKNCFFTLLSAIFFRIPITRTFFRFPSKVRVIVASHAGVFRGARISSLPTIRAPLKTPAWEARVIGSRLYFDCVYCSCRNKMSYELAKWRASNKFQGFLMVPDLRSCTMLSTLPLFYIAQSVNFRWPSCTFLRLAGQP